jgi:hypothetical protein
LRVRTDNESNKHSTRRTSWIVIIACALSILSTAVNVAANVFRKSSNFSSTASLEYPNQYVGLETARLHDISILPPIVNFPLLLAQINASDPSTVFADLHRWPSGFGMVYPEDRRFLVSDKVISLFTYCKGSRLTSYI